MKRWSPGIRISSMFDQAHKVQAEGDRLAADGKRDAAFERYMAALRWANESKAAGAHDLRIRCHEAIVRLGGQLPGQETA